jgi:hypothetical protein
MEIQKVSFDDEIICPYCKKVLLSPEYDEYKICEHTIFVDTSYGFDWIREDLKDIVTELFSERYDEESLSKFPLKGTLIASEDSSMVAVSVYYGFVEEVVSEDIKE